LAFCSDVERVINSSEQVGRLAGSPLPCHALSMSTLAEIEAAAETLPAEQKRQLLLFLAARLRAAGEAKLPPPLQCNLEQVEGGGRGAQEGMRHFDAAAHRAWLQRTWGARTFTEDEVRETRVAQERGDGA
jgi:hypothetical protein